MSVRGGSRDKQRTLSTKLETFLLDLNVDVVAATVRFLARFTVTKSQRQKLRPHQCD